MERDPQQGGTDLGILDLDAAGGQAALELLRRRFDELNTIYGVAAAVDRAADLDEVLRDAIGRLAEALGTQRASVLLLDEEGVMRFRAWQGLSDEYRAAVAGHSPWAPDAENPQPIVVPDVLADEHLAGLRDAIVGEGIRALVFVPLVHQRRLIGKLMVYWDEPRVLEADEIRLSQAIASHVAAAAQRRRVERELQESRDRLQVILHGVADGITVQDAAGRLLFANDAAARMMGVENGESALAMSAAEIMAGFELIDETGAPLPPDRLPGRSALRGEPAEAVVGYRIRATGEVRWSYVKATPIGGEPGRADAAINIFHDVTTRHRAEETVRFLAAASEVLAESLDYERTLAQVARLAVPRIGDWCVIYIVQSDDTIERIAIEHAGGRQAELAALLAGYPLVPTAEGGVPSVLRSGRPLLVTETSPELVTSDIEAPSHVVRELESLGIGSWMCVPLTARGRTIGAISLMSAESGRRFGDDDLELAQELAHRAALAVDNARLFDETQTLLAAERIARREAEEAAERLRRLQLVTDATLAELSLDALLPNLLERVRDLLMVDTAAVLLVDEREGELVATMALGLEQEVERGVRIPIGRGFAGRVAAERRAVVIDDVSTADIFNALIVETGIRSLLGVPLIVEARVIGVLHVGTLTERPFTPEDSVLLQLMGDRIALAIENARLYRAAEDRARAAQALTFVGDAVVLVDPDGIVRLWNPAAEDVTGLRDEAVLGRPLAEAIPGWPDLGPRIPVAQAGVAGAARPEALPVEIGDRELWLSISGVAFADGTVYAFRDITREIGLEKMKSDFVSTVSHELRTPLAAIYGAALTLRRDDVPLDPEQRSDLLGVIANEADRLARIVNDILWTSRIESDNVQVMIEPVDAVELVRSFVQATRLHLPDGIRLDLQLDGDLPPLAADPDKVRQVLSNLVENAIKYSPGRGTVEVRLEARPGIVRLLVRDEGIGIPPDEQERVFEKFYRLDPGLTRGVGGTGLGLYICRELVRRMDGRVWVDSTPGRGSTFVVELPVAERAPV